MRIHTSSGNTYYPGDVARLEPGETLLSYPRTAQAQPPPEIDSYRPRRSSSGALWFLLALMFFALLIANSRRAAAGHDGQQQVEATQ